MFNGRDSLRKETFVEVRDAIEEFKFSRLRLSPQTQHWYETRLLLFAGWCEKHNLKLEQVKATHTRRYLEDLRTTPSQATGKLRSSYTVHGHARAIRGFLRWCSREEDMEEYVTPKAARVDMPKLDKKVVDIFTPEELTALLKACSKEITPEMQKKAYAAILLLYDTGIRAEELCGLTLDNVHLTDREAYIKVLGKGRKEREIGLGRRSREALYKYIRRFRKANKEEQHVFLTRWHTPMTTRRLDQMVYRLADWAGVEHAHPHKFRHTYAMNYLAAGGDFFDLCRLMGHSTTEVTRLYLEAYTSQQARKRGPSVGDLLK
jgi:integrase/recombinase XerD